MKSKKVIIRILIVGIILIGGLWIWLGRNVVIYPYNPEKVKEITINEVIITDPKDIEKVIPKLNYAFSHLRKVYSVKGVRKTPLWSLKISYNGQQFETTGWLGVECWVGNSLKEYCHFFEIDNEMYVFEIPEENELHFIFGDLYPK